MLVLLVGNTVRVSQDLLGQVLRDLVPGGTEGPHHRCDGAAEHASRPREEKSTQMAESMWNTNNHVSFIVYTWGYHQRLMLELITVVGSLIQTWKNREPKLLLKDLFFFSKGWHHVARKGRPNRARTFESFVPRLPSQSCERKRKPGLPRWQHMTTNHHGHHGDSCDDSASSNDAETRTLHLVFFSQLHNMIMDHKPVIF